MRARSSRGNKSDAPSQKGDSSTLPAAASLPATQPQVDTGSPTATLPSQDLQCPRNVQTQSATEKVAAAGAPAPATAGKDINSESFHRRIHEDHQHQHHHPHQRGHLPSENLIPGVEHSIGEEWIPASAQHTQQHSAGGWSYSEGDDVNVPETNLPKDARFSQIDGTTGATGATGAGIEDGGNAVAAQQHVQSVVRQRYGPEYKIIAQEGPQRKPVQERYPAYRQQQQQEYSMMDSVCQPTPDAAAGGGAAAAATGGGGGGELISAPASAAAAATAAASAGADKVTKDNRVYNDNGLEEARMANMPTPQQVYFSGNSAAQRNLTPEEKEAIEGRKQAALARRGELERERGNKVARILQFGGGYNVSNPRNQQQQQQQGAPALAPPEQIQAQPLPFSALNPAPAQRVEENRQRALNIRQNKLMEEAVALAHVELASNPSTSGGSGGGGKSTDVSGWKARIKQDIRKLITAQRHGAHLTSSSASPSPLSTPSAGTGGAGTGGGSTGGGGGRQLTPEQRQRAEENRQKALQRQMDKVEERVAAFLNAGMQRAQNEKAAGAGATAARVQQQQRQSNDDQMFRRFL